MNPHYTGRMVCVGAGRFRLPAHEAAPLRYQDWLGYVTAENIRTGQVPVVRVQVRKRGVMFCGRVLEAAPASEGHSIDWFKVDSYLGQMWFPDQHVRLCSGDGRCTCEDEFDAAREPRACAWPRAALTVPPGNTGTTVRGEA